MSVMSAATKKGAWRAPASLATTPSAPAAVDVDEADARALARELLDQRRADPARAAGDQDAAVDQARVAREWG